MLTTRLLFLLPATLLLIACPDDRGPAEKIGESIDETSEKIGDSLEEAGEEIEDAVTEDGPVEELGESIDETFEGDD